MVIELTEREETLVNTFACNLFNRGLAISDDRDEDHDPNFDMVEAELKLMAMHLKKEIYHEVSDLLLNHAMTDTNVIDNVIESKQPVVSIGS